MEEWIGSVAGLALHDGRLFLLDRGDPRVVVLSGDDLVAVSEFGRIGQGPGELEPPLVPWAHPASDGASRSLLRFDLETRRVDTLALPRWPVPDVGEEARQRGEALARSGLPGADLEPTSLQVWTDLTIDPDGSAWMELWREDRSEPARVAIVDLGTGHVHEATVPTFPKAFGTPGTFYGVQFDEETDMSVIVKYRLGQR